MNDLINYGLTDAWIEKNTLHDGLLLGRVISKEVKEAFKSNRPVVALESTIISHGMPYPKNVEIARSVEQIIIDGGAIPATIAIIGGKLKVGLS